MIPQGIDQDPYFRMTRDIAEKLKYKKPCCLHSKMFPSIRGFKEKMSGRDPNSAIFLTDTQNQIKNKINKHAFSGGQETADLQREQGANVEVDIPYNWLVFFLEDDAQLAQIKEDYSTGKMLTGEIKSIQIELLQNIVREHQEKRKLITNDEVLEWMKIRPIKTTKDE